jgi:predicted O-methyltransferase YrrM
MKTWQEEMEHEATRLYYDMLRAIIDPSAKHILEIGVAQGISTHAFLQNKDARLISIDKNDDDKVLQARTYNEQERWRFKKITSDDFFALNKLKFDIIYIDGDHRYEQVSRDINNAWECLNVGGQLIGHDVIHRGNFIDGNDCGVMKAFAEFIDGAKVRATIYPPHPGLIVIIKR